MEFVKISYSSGNFSANSSFILIFSFLKSNLNFPSIITTILSDFFFDLRDSSTLFRAAFVFLFNKLRDFLLPLVIELIFLLLFDEPYFVAIK